MTKLFTIAFTLQCVSISLLLASNGNAQVKSIEEVTVHLSLNEVKVEKAFKELERITEFNFVFAGREVRDSPLITVESQGESLYNLLVVIATQSNLRFKQIDKNIHVIKSEKENTLVVTEQVEINISGTVTDENGEPLPGATVTVEGSISGTVTDIDGNYSIDVNEGAVLVVSFIGYKTKRVTVSNQSQINVAMELDESSLEEVVVVGYGTQKKINLTASVEVVDRKVLENRPIISVTEMLQGSVANLNINTSTSAPGKSSGINIRGFTGRNQSGEPLIIVDGVPYDIDLINPNDVESISVLKDAAASAIYGSQAPNGVIIITTKSGSKNKKMVFSYSNLVRASTPLNLPRSLNSYDFALHNNEAGHNSQAAPEYPESTIERIRAYISGEISDNNVIENGRWGFAFTSNANEDYYGIAFRDVVLNHSHNFSIQGGGEKTSYYISAGYQRDQGVYNSDIDNFQTKNVTVRINTDVNRWLKFGLNTRFTNHESVRPNIMGGLDNDGNFMNNIAFRPNIPNINRVGEFEGINEFSILPSLTGEGGRVNRVRNNLITGFTGELTPFEGLSIKASFTINLDAEQDQSTTFVYSVVEPNGSITRSRRSANQNVLEKWRNNTLQQTTNIVADYHKIFGRHDFNVLAGFQNESREYDFLHARNTDFYTNNVPSFSTMYGENQFISDNIYSWATRGYFGRLSYNYDGKYLFDINSRYDATSRYSSNTRWAFFPSVSVGYNVARENFWPLKDQFEMFKIRGSWGRLGNAGIGRPRYIAPLQTGSQLGQVLGGARPAFVTMPGIVSDDLTWTKPRTIGFGIEVGALRNQLLFTYDWYQRTVFDEEGVAEQLPTVLGTTPPARNNAISETRGWEVSAEWRDQAFEIRNERISYSVRFMLSDFIGYVVQYADNPEGQRNLWTPGEKFGQVFGYQSAGIQTSAIELQNGILHNNGWFYPGDLLFNDIDGDGRIGSGDGNFWYSQGDRVKLGYNYPRYRFSAILSSGWKGFNLRILLEGVGHEVRYLNNKFTTGVVPIGSRGLLDFHGDLGYWNMDNQGAFFPRLYTNTKNFNMANDQYKQDLSYMRIKNINLSYNIPESVIKGDAINNVSIYVSMENAGMIFNNAWSPFDPQFIKSSTYPPSRIVGGGLKFNL